MISNNERVSVDLRLATQLSLLALFTEQLNKHNKLLTVAVLCFINEHFEGTSDQFDGQIKCQATNCSVSELSSNIGKQSVCSHLLLPDTASPNISGLHS